VVSESMAKIDSDECSMIIISKVFLTRASVSLSPTLARNEKI